MKVFIVGLFIFINAFSCSAASSTHVVVLDTVNLASRIAYLGTGSLNALLSGDMTAYNIIEHERNGLKALFERARIRERERAAVQVLVFLASNR